MLQDTVQKNLKNLIKSSLSNLNIPSIRILMNWLLKENMVSTFGESLCKYYINVYLHTNWKQQQDTTINKKLKNYEVVAVFWRRRGYDDIILFI